MLTEWEVEALLKLVDCDWAGQVSEVDPRFQDLMPPDDRGTVLARVERIVRLGGEGMGTFKARRLLSVIPKIQERVDRLVDETLQSSLHGYLELLCDPNAERCDAMALRLGWAGEKRLTLEATGRILGITRERVRQIEKRLRQRISKPVFMPALGRALQTLVESSPIAVAEASQLLRRSGITSRACDPNSVLIAATDCGMHVQLETHCVRGENVLIDPVRLKAIDIDRLVKVARKQAGASRVSRVDEVIAELAVSGLDLEPELAQRVLGSSCSFLTESWFWFPDIKPNRNRLRNVLRKILSVCVSVEVGVARDGIRRHYNNRQSRGLGTWRLLPPTRNALTAFVVAHPEFSLERNEIVSVTRLDWREELSGDERSLMGILWAARGQILRREEFHEVSSSKGVSAASFSHWLSDSPVVRQVATGVWGIRGQRVDPALVETLRSRSGRSGGKRVDFVEWTDGGPRIEVRLPGEINSVVVGIPAAIRSYVSGQCFDVVTSDGDSCGAVRIVSNGSSWGYGRFLRRVGADPGDLLRVDFDLADKTVRLEIVDDAG